MSIANWYQQGCPELFASIEFHGGIMGKKTIKKSDNIDYQHYRISN